MIGIKRTEYSVINNEVGQAFKRKLLEKYDVISVQEDKELIIITVGEAFNTNEFMWV